MAIDHHTEAEKHLANAARHLTEVPADMRIAEVAALIGNGYATLAARQNGAVQQPSLDSDPNQASQTISRNVRCLRLARGWTQEQAGQYLGRITGITWSNAVWSLAEAQTRPRDWTASEIVALARLFDVTVEHLFQVEAPPRAATSEHPSHSDKDRALEAGPQAWERLGDSLRNARESRGLSRRALSEMAEVSEKAIQMAEEGRVPAGRWPQSITRIASALGWPSGVAVELILAEDRF
jgi:transcriptional regulator with XRE-family HTH domain